MSIISGRRMAIAVIAACVGAGMSPTETLARVSHRHSAARAHSAFSYGYVAPPVVVFRAPPLQYSPPLQSAGDCDIARDWNC